MLHCDETISAGGRPVQADALIEFRVKEVQQEPITTVLEFKSRLTPLILEGTIHQVLGISNSLRASAAYGEVYPMVGAPYISESVRNRCKELGVGYVDLNGTLLLARGNIYVDVIRPATAYKNPQGIKRIFFWQIPPHRQGIARQSVQAISSGGDRFRSPSQCWPGLSSHKASS